MGIIICKFNILCLDIRLTEFVETVSPTVFGDKCAPNMVCNDLINDQWPGQSDSQQNKLAGEFCLGVHCVFSWLMNSTKISIQMRTINAIQRTH